MGGREEARKGLTSLIHNSQHMEREAMPMEIEVKAYAKDLKEVEEKIKSMGAKLVWEGEQMDTYYSHPSRNFAATDEALRVRIEEGKAFITYKGPKIDNISKTREEIKVQVEDATAANDILKKLGFKEVGAVRKLRKKFLLGELKICLDTVENLGEFVEIEILEPFEDSKTNMDELRTLVLKTMDELGLKEKERKSYLELLHPELQ